MIRSFARRFFSLPAIRKNAARLVLEHLESRAVPALFNTLSPVTVGGSANFGCVATGDFTGNSQDGKTDLVMTNYGSATSSGNTLTILEPTGNGTFTVGSTITVGSNQIVEYVAVGDLNGDGTEDLAVVTSNFTTSAGDLIIYKGNGNGTFTKGNTYATGLNNVDWVGIAPMFSGSTVPSIVVSAFGHTTAAGGGSTSGSSGGGTTVKGNGIEIYQGNGNGTFSLATTYQQGVSFIPTACALGYFTGSSNLDIACTIPGVPPNSGASQPNGSVEVIVNDGSGGLNQGNSFDSGGPLPISIATTEFTSSGLPDLVVANAGDPTSANFPGSSIGVLINTGGDSFSESTITVGIGANSSYGVFAVATGDFNQDGNQDIAAVEYGNASNSGNAALLEYAGNGQGGFTHDASNPYQTTTQDGQFLAVGNFGNGVPDIAICTASSSYDVFMNTTVATTTTVTSTPASPITLGTSIDFTATISGSPSVGTVTFYAGPGLTNPIGSPVSVSNGTATSVADTTLPVGTDTITAVYSGGSGFAGSQGTENVTVNNGTTTTTTTVTSTPAGPITVGTSITFTATISGSPSVGTVTFYAGPGLTNPIGSAVNVSNGTATSAADTTLPVGTDTITAVYSGGTGFAGSQGTENVAVNNSTTTTVTSTPAGPITVGTSIDFTATISGSPSVGTVTFYARPGLTNPIGSAVNVSNGTATSAADTTLPVGTDTITAVYSGGTGFAGSQGTENVSVNNSTTTTVTSTPTSPITVGTSIDFTATISGSPSVGTVTFYAGPGLTNPIGSAVNVSGGTATSTADTTLPVGTDTITAVYSGGTGFAGSQGTENVTVNNSTTTTVTSTPTSPITVGTSIDFSATISGSPSVGTVTFYAGPGLTNPIGSAVNVSNGTATSAADTTLPVGTDTITAVYSGGTGFAGSQGTENVSVNNSTTTTVTSTPTSPITVGTSIDFTATISGSPSAGTVTFYAGPGLTNPIGSAVNVSGGTATSAADTNLPVGTDTITAVYSGGTGFAGSQGTENVTVNNSTTTTVTSTPTSPITVGTSITFTATISGDPSVGTVTFYAGPGLTNPIGSAVNVSGGTATSAADTTLPLGSNTITAFYSGGTGFPGSQGTENVTVNNSTTTTVTSTPASPITSGTSIDFTATISGSPSVGTVTFYAGPGLTNPIGSAVNVSSGTATSAADTNLPVGTDTITAVYSGGTNFAGSQGTENVTVNNSTTTTVTSTPASPITAGTSIDFTATISGNPSVGTVTFYAVPGLTNPIGSPVNVSGGTATSAADTTLPAGTDTITAVYSGGTGFVGSQGTESVAVNNSTTTTVTSTPSSPIASGTSIDFTATITGDPSVGTVSFYVGSVSPSNLIGSPVTVVNGSAHSASIGNLVAGTDTITAVYSGGTGFAGSQGSESVQVLPPPTVATPAAANPNPVTATTTALSVLGSDVDFPESSLTYTWTTIGTPPASVSFSANGTNAAQDTTATFTAAGTYDFQVTITDPFNLTATSSVVVAVNQTLTSIVVSPTPVTVPFGTTQSFSATAEDQFGKPLSSQPTFSWLSNVGTIDASGKFTAQDSSGTGTVTATSGSIIGTAAVTVFGQPPAFTSSTSTTFTTGTSGSFSVTASGFPAPTFIEAGPLPSGVHFTSAGVLSGTPAVGADGVFPIVFIAVNGVSPFAVQAFTLTVDQAPAITSATGTGFTIGASASFSVTASGYPNPTFTESGALPSGVTLTSAGVLSGTPAPGTVGSYPIVITATNGVSPDATQPFTLMIGQAPSLTNSFVTVSPGSVQAGTTSTITLQGVDLYGNDLTVGGLNVAFALASGSGGQGTIGAVTDHGNGTYTATFTGTIAGSNTITATIGGHAVTSTAPSITVTPGPISLSNSQVSVLLPSVQLGGVTTVVLQGEDAYGNLETSGGVPSIAFELENRTGGLGTISSVTDNNNGTYTATFLGTLDGSNTIEATIGGSLAASTAAIGVTGSNVNLVYSIITASPGIVQSGTGIPVTLQAESGKGIKETSGGLIVAFGLSSGNGGQGTFGPVSYLGGGLYRSLFTGTIAGVNSITATIDGSKVASRAAPIKVTVGQLSYSNSLVTVSAPSVKAGTRVAVTFQPRDAAGNKLNVKGLLVSFTLGGTSTAQGTFTNALYNRITGTYTALFTGTIVGGSTIVTTVNSAPVTSTPPVITVTPGTASAAKSTLTILAGSSQVVSGNSITLMLQAVDAYGNLETTGGLPVAFRLASARGGLGRFSKVTDNKNGTYTVTFTGTIAGINTIVSTIGRVKVASTAAIIVTPGSYSLARSVVTVSATSVMTGGTISVLLQTKDAAGNNLTTNLLTSIPISFELGNLGAGGQGTFTSATYIGNGEYQAQFTATALGSNTVVALMDTAPVTSKAPTIKVLS